MIKYLKEYLNNRLLLLKFEAIEGLGEILSRIIAILLLAGLFIFMWFFLMLGISFYIAYYFFEGEIALGFIAIGLIHFLLFLVLLIFRKSLIERKILNFFINTIFSVKSKINNENQ